MATPRSSSPGWAAGSGRCRACRPSAAGSSRWRSCRTRPGRGCTAPTAADPSRRRSWSCRDSPADARAADTRARSRRRGRRAGLMLVPAHPQRRAADGRRRTARRARRGRRWRRSARRHGLDPDAIALGGVRRAHRQQLASRPDDRCSAAMPSSRCGSPVHRRSDRSSTGQRMFVRFSTSRRSRSTAFCSGPERLGGVQMVAWVRSWLVQGGT